MHIIPRSVACISLLVAATAACDVLLGDDEDDGDRPLRSGFDPGNGGGDGYGSGSGAASIIECPAELKRCSQTINFPFNGENTVELRGDFDGLSSWSVGKPMTHSGDVWKVDLSVPFNAPFQYKFWVNGTTWALDDAVPTVKDKDGNKNHAFGGKTCEPALCEEEGALPEGIFDWRDSVIYFPMVDRFLDSDGNNPCRVADGRVADLANYKGGDWNGITQKIDDGYFEDMGVNTLWLSVTADNARGVGEGVGDNRGKWFTGYHGYWPRSLDPKTPFDCFATSRESAAAELKALIGKAHDKNMKVLVDYAMVHAHIDSPLWREHPDWFWTNNGGPYSICAEGPADGSRWEVFSESDGNWFWDPNREGNKCWFDRNLAHWNYGNPKAREHVVNNVIDWFNEYGFDGMRMDAVKHVDMQWLKDVRAKVNAEILPRKKPGERVYLLGESFADTKAKLQIHVNPTTMLDGQFDFVLQSTLQNVMLRRNDSMQKVVDAVTASETYGARVVMSTFLGNHDQERSIGAAGGENQQGYERLANALAVILTVKGAPSILYGDEIGMPGGADPDSRRVMSFDGLSSGQSALKARVAKLGKIRGAHAALRRGSRQTLTTTSDLWVFKMSTNSSDREQDTVYVAVNRGDSAQKATTLPGGGLRELVEDKDVTGPEVSIPPRQTRIFVGR